MNSQLITKVTRTLLPTIAAIALGGCGGETEPELEFPIQAPAVLEGNSLRSEAKVARVHEAISETLAELSPGRWGALNGILTEGFRARFAEASAGSVVADSEFDIRVLEGADARGMDRSEFVRAFASVLEGWRTLERSSFELDRFYLDPSGERATGRAEIYLAGELSKGGRADYRLIADVALEDTMSGWCFTQLDLLKATSISGKVKPFVDITRSAGLSVFPSRANQQMLQSFMDDHRVLALGGITAADWNRDGFMDVIVSVDGSLCSVLVNDGRGGFIPQKGPIELPMNCGVFLLHMDLDGDGKEELVSSRELDYSGESGHFGIYVETESGWQPRLDALKFSNPAGLRGVKAQTVVPFDANGDGLLDLFFGVYGTGLSRGEGYNLVESHDGGRNYLFINQGNLQFREESEERGLSGVQYTYVALPYDFDGDGDTDLFEGNDFGPNKLWLNDGKGHFSADEDSALAQGSAYSMGVTLGDHDDDGRPSLYVVNMSSEAGERIARTSEGLSDEMRERVLTIASGNWLFNQGLDGEWIEQAAEFDCAEGEWGWGAVFCDLDGDGDEELFATNGFTSHHNPTLPDWDPYFWRQVATDGVLMEMGAKSYDVNADSPFEGSYAGYQRDRLFYKADGDDDHFYDTAWHYGLDNLEDGRCVLPFDMDGDGDLDLALYTLQGLRLYQNQSEERPFLRLSLRATKSHPAAIGAQVRVKVGDEYQYETLLPTEGFQTQQPLDLNFLWDAADQVDEVRVTWPSGSEQTFAQLPLGKRVLLVEGQAAAELQEVPRWPAEFAQPAELERADRERPRPNRANADKPSEIRVVRFGSNKNASWALRDTLREAHPNVTFETIDWAALEGRLLVYELSGGLARAFFEEPTTADLSALLEELKEEPWFSGLALMAGRRMLSENKLANAIQLFESALIEDPRSPAAAEGLARAKRMLGDVEGAQAAYLRSIEIDPDYAIGHFNLAVLYLHSGRLDLAIASYEQALRIRGEDRGTLLAMGEAALVGQDREQALGYFERAILAAPQDAEAQVLRGKVLAQMERYEEASAAFAKALELEPKNRGAASALANIERLLAGETRAK